MASFFICYNKHNNNNSMKGNMDEENKKPEIEDQAPVSTPPKKQGGKILAIAIIAMLVGAAGASAVFVGLNGGFDFSKKSSSQTSDNKSENKGDENKDGEDEKESEEVEISDATLKATIIKKANVVFRSQESEDTLKSPSIFDDFSKYENPSKETKSRIILAFFDGKDTISSKDIPSKYMNDYLKQYYAENPSDTIPAIKIDDKVKNYYKSLFGDEMTEFPDNAANNNYFNTCGMVYIPELNTYSVIAVGCGGAISVWPIAYQYKVTTKGDKAYAYFAIGLHNSDENKIYGYFDKKDTVLVSNVEKITSENYKQIPHYRAVFEKQSDGNYIYKTAERVND